jgi:hypothetical protein
MDANSSQPQPGKGTWWFGWIAGAIIVPAIGGAMIFQKSDVMMLLGGFFCIASIILHLAASVKLGKGRWFLGLLLVLGGWAAMATAFFFGCAATYPVV